MRYFVSIVVSLLSMPLLFSQQDFPEELSLDQAIVFALENNYSAINAERDLLDAKKQKWETIATGLPQVNGNVSYQNQLKQPVSLIPAEIFGGEPGTFQEVIFGQPQQVNATATLNQQIFNGTYIVGVQATKTFLEYTANAKEKTDLEIKKAVIEAYGNLLLSNETIEILENNKAALEKNLFETTKIFENGLGDEESVEQLQITLASIDNLLKNAVRLKEVARQMLNLTLGIPIDRPTRTSENLDALVGEQLEWELAETPFNIENNVDYKMAQNLNDQRRLELKLAKSRALPTLNAFLNYGTSAFSDQFDFLGSDTSWFNSSVLGFSLDIPIFSSMGRSASTQRAKIALDKAKTQFTETIESINLQYQTAKSNYIFAIEEYGTAKKNLALAERIEKKNEIKYFEGLASSFDLRQAQTQLYTAQRDYLQSMVNVINQRAELETIIND